jgi:propanol-preferring alcohol dehydrogenase
VRGATRAPDPRPEGRLPGALTGSAFENEDSLRLAHERGIRGRDEIMPLSEAPKAYERMMSGDARFRVVLGTHE